MSSCDFIFCSFQAKLGQMNVDNIAIYCLNCFEVKYCSELCRNKDWLLNHSLKCFQPEIKQSSARNLTQNIQFQSLRCNTLVFDSEVQPIKNQRRIEEFQFLNETSNGTLGKGSSAQVNLVKDKTDNKLYALKIILKSQLYDKNVIENLRTEIKIQYRLQHPNIIKLYNQFQDQSNVYLLLEYAENGNLFQFIRKRKMLPESEAFIYFFQTCLGIDYLHKNNIIHRDLKPENLLLDGRGNIKICDFGWSANITRNSKSRRAFCGTCEYMAPEMIKKLPHDKSLDIWCLGILLYELLHGYSPFRDANNEKIMDNICSFSVIKFDPRLSNHVKNLLESILKSKPQERILMEDIFQQSWLTNMAQFFKIDIHQHIFNYSQSPQLSHRSKIFSSYIVPFQKGRQLFPEKKQQLPMGSANLLKNSLSSPYIKNYKISDQSELVLRSTAFTNNEERPKVEQSVVDKLLNLMGCISRK